MKRQVEFGGMSTYVEEVDFDKHFEEVYNNEDRVFYLGTKEFLHEEEDFTFRYRYGIKVTDIAYATGEAGEPIVVELILLPSFDDLCDKAKESIKDCMGWDEGDEPSEEWKYFDIAEYSYSILMGHTEIHLSEDDIYDWTDSKPIRDIFEAITAVYEVIDRLRGFYLDRAWNRIGTTGWDMLNHALKNEELFKF